MKDRMEKTIVDFLLEDYPKRHGLEAGKLPTIRREKPNSLKFELCDQRETIIQEEGMGDSVILWQGEQVEVIDFEGYIKDNYKEAEEGKVCDFLIVQGDELVLFNEVSRRKPKQRRVKKREAKKQLEASIKRFYEDGENLLDGYKKKVVLFSFRPRSTEQPEEYLVAESKEKFGKPDETNEDLQESFPHGFTFEQRLYPTPYVIE